MSKSQQVKPVPEGYHTLTPYLHVHDAAAALEFYAKAFGAVELFRMDGPPGKIAHAEMKIGDSPFMLADEFPEFGAHAPKSLGGSTMGLMLYVEDADAVFKQAIDAGATEVSPLKDQFWGDRMGKIEDPFGHKWMIATHVEDVPPDEMDRRAKEAMTQMSA